jgi:hypothetical protein
MSILAIVKEALRIARTHKSLWVFGFMVGLSAGGGTSGGGAQATAAATPDPVGALLVGLLVVALVIAFVVFRCVSTGALIEGVKRARRSEPMTFREGLHEGWAHWGVLLRLALLFLAANAASVALLAGACLLAEQLLGRTALFATAGLAVVVGVPWLVTLHIWQAFAERIAVLESRRALDAIRKARLFLHGRLRHGLELVVAALLGTLCVAGLAIAVIVPLILLLAVSVRLVGSVPTALLGALTLPPVVFVAIALVGIMTSSVWTIGYLKEVER